MQITAQDQHDLGIADEIIPEPDGGAHTAAAAIAAAAGEAMHDALDELTTLPVDELLQRRYAGYRAIGRFQERQPPMIERNLPALPFKGL